MDQHTSLFPQEASGEQRLCTFIKILAGASFTPEFMQGKVFDYALALPEVSKRKSTAERLEAAVILINVAQHRLFDEMRTREQELKAQDNVAQADVATEEAVEEAVATV